jgi:hypothetical protein
MTLDFPNVSRSYDETRDLIRFWGYDSAMEVSFFVEVDALTKLDPRTRTLEAGYLETFDAVRDRIHQVARKAYSRARRSAYLLVAADF